MEEKLLQLGLKQEQIQTVQELLNSEISKISAERDKAVADYNSLKIDSAVEAELLRADARNIKAVKALIDNKGISLDEKGNVLGIKEQIDLLRENEETSFLFKEKQVEMRGVAIAGEERDTTPQVNIEDMNYSQLCAYMEANPQAQLN